MKNKEKFFEELFKLGFKVIHNDNNEISLVFMKQYKVATNNDKYPMNLLNKKFLVRINNETIEYTYYYSRVYTVDFVSLSNDANNYIIDRRVTFNSTMEEISKVLDVIKEDINNLNVVRLEEFSWQ